MELRGLELCVLSASASVRSPLCVRFIIVYIMFRPHARTTAALGLAHDYVLSLMLLLPHPSPHICHTRLQVGVCFPVFIMLLVPFRLYIMPKLFDPRHLRALDPLSSEEHDMMADSVPDVPATGTIADITASAGEAMSRDDVLGAHLNKSQMYPRGLGEVPAKLPDIAPLLQRKRELGIISDEEQATILATLAKFKSQLQS